VRRRSLRVRLAFAFGLGAAFISILFAGLAYFGVRHILVADREDTQLRQAYVDAALVRSAVATGTPTVHGLITSMDTGTSTTSVVDLEGVWIANTLAQPRLAVPRGMQVAAAHGQTSRQIVDYQGGPTLFVDVPIPAVHATYYQIVDLSNLEQTLRDLLIILAAGAALTTAIGVAGSLAVTRRAMEPLEVASSAARRVADGELDTRIPVDKRNTEVATLAESFNMMIARLVERLERDARFAGDVSHELRSPLTTLATSVEVMRHYRDQLSPDGRAAFDLLAADVGTFQVLVEDLLEMARFDAGSVSMHVEEVPIDELVRQCVRSAVRRHQLADVPVEVDRMAEGQLVAVDRRRFERVIANLLENAHRYAGGATKVRVRVDGATVQIDVDDAGPGVEPQERLRIFDRFYRGAFSHDRGESRGTGLGLALVADHVSLFGGHIEVRESPESGAEFRIELPAIAEARV
jgi:signal transduction histidine kinase